MATPAIRMYDAMKPSMGEDNAKEFIKALDESNKEFFKVLDERFTARIETIKSEMATKSELNELRKDFDGLRNEFNGLRKDMQSLKLELRGDMFKIACIVGLAQIIIIIGSVIAIIKTMM